ncbi:MAG TPA: signal peptidase II [Firmicutes bacterium]|uniref:Lipoprotein signal peptidase n=1 Tax=Capillibacterium thermochitinicola TaxID=2699427 RepID=A0A8J6LME5_9FIRM|nr:signal peptidase II [Capillibacterium thermochitinicola]MBA2132798.1 signal peptidase II [Capillibacterium thermochitinicola]HHW12961.1 signal peptidase II [Bacillota bacterium]
MFYYVLFVIIVGVDQLTKGLVQRALALHQTVTVIPGVLSFTRINNPGAAFGILSHRTFFLTLMPLVLFFLVFLLRREIAQYPSPFRLGLALCLGGAAGNLIDRLGNGGQVIDFVDLDFWPLDNFPLFNLADTAIFIGALIIFFSVMHLQDER